MTIKYKVGDMVESYKLGELDAYAHQCNCFCRMGRGIAPLLAKVNPDVRVVDNMTEEGDRAKMGNFSVAETDNFPLLFNIYGQYHWSKYKEAPNRNTNYASLESGLVAVRGDLCSKMIDINDPVSLGLPLIGCGLAGGDWKGVVKPMIKELFENSGVDVTVFVLEKDLHLIK